MLSANVTCYGKENPLPERHRLRAGPLSAIYENGDLRTIRLGDREIIRRIYVGVRDKNWGTLQPGISNLQLAMYEDSFQISFHAEHRRGGITFAWDGKLTGDTEGNITYEMDGEALTTFLKNRIGICVLHPIRECAGHPYTVEKVDGSVEQGIFPVTISPHQPIFEIRALSYLVVPEVWTDIRFTGEIFEMEDQRNWTDGSYKTYSTPHALPFPVEIKAGTKVQQSVTLSLRGAVTYMDEPTRPIQLELGRSIGAGLPALGLGASTERPKKAKG